jgi:glycosyltransferase involved in cell wall biosynthesis
MTTTFYPPYHIGGDAIHVKYLAEELVKRGHEVDVLRSLDAYNFKKKSLPKQSETGQIQTHNVKEPFNLSSYVTYILGNSSSINKKFDELLHRVNPDVVHHHNISLLGYGILKKRGRYVNLLTAHDFWLVCQRNSLLRNGLEICEGGSCFLCSLEWGKPPQTWRFSRSFKTSIKSVDLLICPSNYVRRQLSRKTDLKSVTLPNFAPSPPKDISRADYSNYFLFVGVLEIQKGILDLLNLFKQFGPDIGVKLVIVGDGSLRNYIIDFIRRNSLDSCIYYIGSIEDKRKLYSLYKNALAVVIPSICLENAPLVALEAFSVGCPVIGSNNGGLPEIVGKLDKRLIFKNWIELRNILLNFSRNEFPSERIEEVYKQNFSPEIYVDKYLAIIRAMSTTP